MNLVKTAVLALFFAGIASSVAMAETRTFTVCDNEYNAVMTALSQSQTSALGVLETSASAPLPGCEFVAVLPEFYTRVVFAADFAGAAMVGDLGIFEFPVYVLPGAVVGTFVVLQGKSWRVF